MSLIDLFYKKRNYSSNFLNDIQVGQWDLLKDIDIMAKALDEAYQNQDEITILPDFDMDGIMSAVVGYVGLTELGFKCNLYRPDAGGHYGFGPEDIDKILVTYPNTKIILTCDTGITCYEGIEYAQSKGLKVYITDHHKQSEVCTAEIVINPMRLDETYSHPKICGAHVLWQVIYYYSVHYRTKGESNRIYLLRVFAGIGTVSDMMPVLYENRKLLEDSLKISNGLLDHGMEYITTRVEPVSSLYQTAFTNLLTILLKFKADKKITKEVTSEFFGMNLAPLFNSIKRMSADVDIAFRCFIEPQADVQFELLNTLFDLNNQRKELVQKHLNLLNQSPSKYPFVYISQAPAGITGLLAMQLMLKSELPVAVVYEDGDGYRGTGRSPYWYPLLSIASANGFQVAGHEGAFGIQFKDIEEIEKFCEFIDSDLQSSWGNIPTPQLTEVDMVLGKEGDADIDVIQLNHFYDALTQLAPFGIDFPYPTLELRFPLSEATVMYMGNNKQHVKFIYNGLPIIVWSAAEKIAASDSDVIMSVTGKLSLNEFNNKVTLQFIGNLR